MANLLIEHKRFEDDLCKLINDSALPSVMICDIIQKTAEKLNHMIYVETQNEINRVADEQLAQAMKIVKEDNKDEQ